MGKAENTIAEINERKRKQNGNGKNRAKWRVAQIKSKCNKNPISTIAIEKQSFIINWLWIIRILKFKWRFQKNY